MPSCGGLTLAGSQVPKRQFNEKKRKPKATWGSREKPKEIYLPSCTSLLPIPTGTDCLHLPPPGKLGAWCLRKDLANLFLMLAKSTDLLLSQLLNLMIQILNKHTSAGYKTTSCCPSLRKRHQALPVVQELQSSILLLELCLSRSSQLRGSIAPTAGGDCALWHVTTIAEKVYPLLSKAAGLLQALLHKLLCQVPRAVAASVSCTQCYWLRDYNLHSWKKHKYYFTHFNVV